MSIKKVIFIRHGETNWNAEQRWQGHTDIPLNEKGIWQAHETALKVKIHEPQILLSSDLGRAMQTAQIIAELNCIQVQPSPSLREVSTGAAEGLTMGEVIDRFGKNSIERWRSIHPSDIDFAFPSGEVKKDALKRGLGAIENFLRTTSVKCAGFVFHGMLMRTLIHNIFPELQTPVTIANCKHFLLLFDPETNQWFPDGELAELVNAA